ncbi:MAG: Asp-tRNA(Asn)/Glu-tRNA(Gln) amidotransferase subunit GatA [Oscillospiraceae bacterium]|nr:Asp-tRNA(Asn)/Glu-tRNA(Gln) amidotransferase subunit GatA [Oscillospiraceae bacterium]
MNDLLKCTVKELSNKLNKKQISAVELTDAYLKRINEVDGKVNSYITVCNEQARISAEKAQKIIDAGSANALTGIPMSIKDNICTKDIRTTCASKMLEDFNPIYNATVINRLNDNNIVMLGKTNMDEFAMGGSSQTSFFGGVKNPYNTECVTGGSSGGSAASVAANLCAASLGSDTGGSVRQPAAFCGVTGLKPTYGAVSRYGLIAFASSLDQIGPVARSAEDCGIILSAIAGRDENDGTIKNIDKADYCSKIGMSMKGIRIGIPKEFFGDGIDSEVRQAVMNAAKEYEKMGCILEEVTMPSLKYAVASYYLISSAEAASNLSRFDGIKYGYRSENGNTYEEIIKNTRHEGFGAEVKRRIMLGNYALSSGYYDAYYNKAVKIRGKIKAEYDEIFKTCDCILTPTAPSVAYKIGALENDPVKMYSADICTVTVNIAGLPAISTPCGYSSNNMPIGMSIVGNSLREATIIAVADAFEKQFETKEASI